MLGWESPALNRDALPRIDLNHERRQEREALLSRSRRTAIAFAVVLITAALGVPTLFDELMVRRVHLERAEAEAAVMDKRFYSVAEMHTRVATHQARWTRFTQSRARRRAWRDILPAVAARMPGGIYLERTKVEVQGTAVQTTLQGTAATMEHVKYFADGLARDPFFSHSRLLETTADSTLWQQGVRFRITAQVGGALADGANADAR